MIQCPHCSAEFRPKERRRRSPAQHRRFFGMVAAAYNNWPSDHEFQPTSAEHLRKWLTAKAQFVERIVIDAPEELIWTDERSRKLAEVWLESTVEAVRASHEFSWVRRHGSAFVIFVPKSIAFDKMGPQDFGHLNDKVSEVLDREIGMDGDELLRGRRSLACA